MGVVEVVPPGNHRPYLVPAVKRRKAHDALMFLTSGLLSKCLLLGGMPEDLRVALDRVCSCLTEIIAPVVEVQVG